jgi:GT2 family glycosyltransferase
MAKILSVIIPVHDKAASLPLMLESLRGQRLPDDQFELIFVTDRCTDESPLIIEDFQRSFVAEIVTISCEEGSAARARNLGIRQATGKYYLFLDADVIIPPDLFGKLISQLRAGPDAVFLVPIYGNSGSLPIWPFVVHDHDAWRSMDTTQLLEWAATQTILNDLRIGFANKADGSFDHLPAPWVFCWSSAMAISRELMAVVGGFSPLFAGKGSEDLELGYQLHTFGASFKMSLETHALHLPHARNRNSEERTDRLHEREMLKQHPTPQVEILCAFDGAHANPMLELLEGINADTLSRLGASLSESDDPKELNLPQRVKIAMGTSPDWLLELVAPDYVICPYVERRKEDLPLFGFALPFEDGEFEAAVLIGLWQVLPERLACRLIDEALRVATEVYLLKDKGMKISIPISSEQLAIHDSPYWERTRPLRRSYYDFELTLCGRDRTLCSYRVGRSSGDAG